jgi:hypothetical protein
LWDCSLPSDMNSPPTGMIFSSMFTRSHSLSLYFILFYSKNRVLFIFNFFDLFFMSNLTHNVPS